MKNYLIVFFLLFFGARFSGFAQGDRVDVLAYEVNKVYPYLPITKAMVGEAKSLADLNKKYKPDWIREYLSVEILASVDGQTKSAFGQNEVLNSEQKDLMLAADVKTDVVVKIHYLPENNLSQNEPKIMDFKLAFIPEHEATFVGGSGALEEYLKEKLIQHIPEGLFKSYALATVTFNITDEGEIVDPHLFWSSKDEKVDELMLETIRKMPCWKPAEYKDGTKVKQEYVLMVGDMRSCAVNMLNVHPDKW